MSPSPKRPTRSERRATRLKVLRPELAPSIRKVISLTDALKLGGYGTADDMDNDLKIREIAVVKLEASKAK